MGTHGWWALAILAALTIPPVPAVEAQASPPVTQADAPLGAATISGTVLDAQGRAVHGARVALVPVGLFDPVGARYAAVETAADGSFRLPGTDGSRYRVTVTAPGGAANSEPNIQAGHAGLQLQLSNGGRRLSGRLIDRTGRARAGAEIRLSRSLGENGEVFLVESGADGRWSAIVPEGDYHASAVRAAHVAGQRGLPRGRDTVELVLDKAGSPGAPPVPVIDWLRRNQIKLATVEPGHGFADLAPVRTIVGDARVVGLGEATHGTREIFQLKHRMLEYLVSEMGFNVFAIEFSLPESFAIDDYVMGGKGDPERLIDAQFVSVWQAEELLDVVRWMRAWNDTHTRKVRFQGLDMRTGIHAAQQVLAYFDQVDRASLSSPAAQAIALMADPFDYRDVVRRARPELTALVAQARALLAQLEARRGEYEARSNREIYWRAVMQARTLVQLLEWRAASDTAERVKVREHAMADNAIRALDHYGPDARALVWAHNAHVFGDAEADPQMAGVHLRARLGDDYRAFGSVLHQGMYQGGDPETGLLRDFTIAPPAPGSLEDTLASTVAPVAAINLRALPRTGTVADWFSSFHAMRQFDGLYDDRRPEGWASPAVIAARDYDALLFVANGTAARPLPSARALYMEAPPPPKPLANPDFEEDRVGQPAAWLWAPAREAVCGYTLGLDRDKPLAGHASARIARTPKPRYGACAGQLRQMVDAAPYRGKRVRLRGSVRVESAGDHAHFYLQSGVRRIASLVQSSDWKTYDIELDVPGDSPSLELGLGFDGECSVWLDAVSLTVLPGPPGQDAE